MDQDWEPVVLRKKTTGKPKTAAALDKAQREGKVEVVERFDHGNKQSHAPVNARKLEEETEDFKHVHVTHEFRMALQKARQEKKMTQADLAKAIAVKPSVIQEYENGKAIPDPAIISKLNRVLGVTLPRIPKKKAPKSDDDS